MSKLQETKVLKTSISKKDPVKFNYYEFFKWLSIGFVVAGFGIAIAILLAILTGKEIF